MEFDRSTIRQEQGGQLLRDGPPLLLPFLSEITGHDDHGGAGDSAS
jgi:hypothetical protein